MKYIIIFIKNLRKLKKEKWGFDKENRGVIIFENDLNLKCNNRLK